LDGFHPVDSTLTDPPACTEVGEIVRPPSPPYAACAAGAINERTASDTALVAHSILSCRSRIWVSSARLALRVPNRPVLPRDEFSPACKHHEERQVIGSRGRRQPRVALERHLGRVVDDQHAAHAETRERGAELHGTSRGGVGRRHPYRIA